LKSFFQSLKNKNPHWEVEPLWFEWLVLVGLFVFATWLLGIQGVWHLLLSSDPTGITLIIIIIFAVATLWCGVRSRELARQRDLLSMATTGGVETMIQAEGWAGEYWNALALNPQDSGAPMDLLLEHTHGAHSTAWWVNGVQLKLGLLGKVIGFSILALDISQIQNFDASQSSTMLKSLTGGLGVALLTTAVGLVANMLLGVQLVRMDRCGDGILADSLEFAETGLPLLTQPTVQEIK
jgi:hypothetical protein